MVYRKFSTRTEYLNKAYPRLRDPACWLPLAGVTSSRNPGLAFLRDYVSTLPPMLLLKYRPKLKNMGSATGLAA